MNRIKLVMDELASGASSITDENLLPSIQEIVSVSNPSKILEIGFYTGRSTALFLEASEASVVTCDVGEPWVELATINKSLETLDKYYPGRVSFILKSSQSEEFRNLIKPVDNKPFDFCFIDGRHEEGFPLFDIETSLLLGCRYILMDDYVSGPNCPWGVIQSADKAVSSGRIEKVKEFPYSVKKDTGWIIYNNMALFKNLQV